MKGAAWTAARTPLRLGDAVAAIILVDDRDYLLQLRDPLAQIWYPDHWGTFGGAVDPGEDEMGALRRELREELAFELDTCRLVSRLDFHLPDIASETFFRAYYEIRIASAQIAGFVLGEGAKLRAFAPEDVFGGLRVTPYDAFALFLHHARRRLEEGMRP